jgi:two-component system LytT family sensor kinase
MFIKKWCDSLEKITHKPAVFTLNSYFTYMTFRLSSFKYVSRDHHLFYHFLWWAVFIAYEMSFVKLILGVKEQELFVFGYVFPYIINISLFYFHADVALRLCFTNNKRRYLPFAGLVILEMCVYLYLMAINSTLGIKHSFHPLDPFIHMDVQLLLRQLWRGIYFAVLSSAYWFVKLALRREKKIREMEKKEILNQAEKNMLEKNLVEMQYSYLQSQINPHLLFNTLNFIYNEVQETSQTASESVLLLAELMNYSLRELEADSKISLEKEIEQIKRIIKINQIRFNNKLYLDIEYNGDFNDARFVPLGLLPFVENMFKHGDLTDRNNPGKITISYNGKIMEFITLNKKRTTRKPESHGIGVKNVTKRLDNIYNNAYSLITKDLGNDFCVHLTVHLNHTP